MSIFGREIDCLGLGWEQKINCKWAQLIDTLIVGMIENLYNWIMVRDA